MVSDTPPAVVAGRCDARFSLSRARAGGTAGFADRVWCMGDLGHDGDHWVSDTYYTIQWSDRVAFRPARAEAPDE